MSAGYNASLAEALGPKSSFGSALWQLGLIVAGAAVLTISAKTHVDLFAVPMTLQTLAVFALAAAYGMRLGVATVLLYLVEGAAGLPVFAGTPEKGIGLAYMMGPTGGYLAGFVVAMALVGYAADRGFGRNPLKLGAAMLAGEAVILLLGFLWLAIAFGAEKAFAFGIGPFIATDLVKIAIAACAVPAVTALLIRR
ncbi:MAG TPA: biotin transporter BioY [Rhizobiaceae bacterium]|nr:biotin transporter BioY [Rhizobiaceae bacterium]